MMCERYTIDKNNKRKKNYEVKFQAICTLSFIFSVLNAYFCKT